MKAKLPIVLLALLVVPAFLRADVPAPAVGTPPDGAPRMFDIWMNISNTRHGTSKYSADYHRHPGCPQRVASAMMDIYHTIKSVLRESRNALRERKQQKKGTDK